jgi:hypothetical protein
LTTTGARLFGVTVTVGAEHAHVFTGSDVVEQPLSSVTVTSYGPVPHGLVTIVDVEPPSLHRYVYGGVPPDAFASSVESGSPQGSTIVVDGFGSTVTVSPADVSTQPLSSVISTVYVAAVVTVIAVVVAPPGAHRYVYGAVPAPVSLAVKTTLSPSQNVVGPLGVIVAVGFGFTTTVTVFVVSTHPGSPVSVTSQS